MSVVAIRLPFRFRATPARGPVRVAATRAAEVSARPAWHELLAGAFAGVPGDGSSAMIAELALIDEDADRLRRPHRSVA